MYMHMYRYYFLNNTGTKKFTYGKRFTGTHGVDEGVFYHPDKRGKDIVRFFVLRKTLREQ